MSDDVTKEEGTEETPAEETKEEATEAPAEEAKEETPAEEPADEGADVEVPEKFKSIVEAIENMSVLDLNELVKLFEKKFGVSAAAVAAAPGGAGAGEAAEEKSDFNVKLVSFGESKIGVIKAVKAGLGLGLKEAKELVEAAPTVIKEKVAKEDAEAMKAEIEAAGGTVELE